MTILSALLIGLVAGFRAMTPLAIVSWCANFEVLNLAGSPLAFMASRYTAFIFTLLAIGELIVDKLPNTPSRKTPPAFIARTASGCFVGATLGSSSHMLLFGLICGAIGAVVGTLAGSAMRARLAQVFGRDLPAALIEDILGIAIGLFAVLKLA